MGDNFKASSKEEWQSLIEKSSKGKSYESFSKELDGLTIHAFNMATDVVHSGAIARRKSGWKIGVDYHEQEAEQLNADILRYLNLGAEAISVPVNTVEDLALIYKDVHADWIHNDLILHPDIDPQKILAFFPKNTSLSIRQATVRLPNNVSSSLRLKKQNSHTEYIVALLAQAENILSEGNALDNIVLHVDTHVYIPLDVSFLRALRIVWANYMSAKGFKDTTLKIASHIVSMEEDKDIQLIEQCVASMNAAMGGADYIYIQSSSSDNNYERLSLQIQNVMKMESKMERDMDVFKGSFAIENLSNTLAKNAWELAVRKLG